jgi:cytochrome c
MPLGESGTPAAKNSTNKERTMIKNREWVIKTWGVSSLGASVAVAVLALIAFSAVLRSQAGGQSERDGQALFEKRCSGCHNLDADHEGPRLRGVFGRPAGKVKTFQYSEALQKAQFAWDEAKLDKWLIDTESVVPDNDMAFRVPKAEERAAIISYLKSLSTP